MDSSRYNYFISILLAILVAPSVAVLVGVDADGLPNNSPIGNAFPGVTLQAVGPKISGTNEVYAINPNVYLQPFTPSTGSMVFGTDMWHFQSLWGGWSKAKLQIDFVVAPTYVSLDAISNDSDDIGVLEAFDKDDNLVDTYTTASIPANDFETMSISSLSGNIAYVIAGGVDFSSVGLDNLIYNVLEVQKCAELNANRSESKLANCPALLDVLNAACPCDGSRKNHSAYVSCVRQRLKALEGARAITDMKKMRDIIRRLARSNKCLKKNLRHRA